jgi:hypothetical protein
MSFFGPYLRLFKTYIFIMAARNSTARCDFRHNFLYMYIVFHSKICNNESDNDDTSASKFSGPAPTMVIIWINLSSAFLEVGSG